MPRRWERRCCLAASPGVIVCSIIVLHICCPIDSSGNSTSLRNVFSSGISFEGTFLSSSKDESNCSQLVFNVGSVNALNLHPFLLLDWYQAMYLLTLPDTNLAEIECRQAALDSLSARLRLTYILPMSCCQTILWRGLLALNARVLRDGICRCLNTIVFGDCHHALSKTHQRSTARQY